ncbi:hypothetical protein BRC62_03425 [Halobacteriales archaeon QH_10_67_13]|nr:MAG: hypothetical protein BRC62_03425 [Halobacteriales archaeon QH_10_67_13]
MLAVSLRQSRTAGVSPNLLGIAGVGVAWYVLPGVLLLPFMLVWGIERWQYDTLVTWAHLVSTSVLVSWYVGVMQENVRSPLTDRPTGPAVASGVAVGTVLAASGELLWGTGIAGDVRIIALRFDTSVAPGVLALFLGAVVLTPPVQEAFFRGVLQDHADAALSATGAILVSGTAFALLYPLLFYVGNALSMLVTAVFLFPQGCLLGYLYHRHETILTPALAHATVNLYAFGPLLI